MKTATSLKVITYGSGPASELVRTYNTDSMQSLSHISRQSLISAMGGPSLGISPTDKVAAVRAERVVREDLRASLRERISQHAESVDLLIWDINDERFGVVTTGESTYLTRSPQLKKAAFPLPRDSRIISFGTNEHFALWQTASRNFVSFLKQLGLLDTTVVLDIPWASVDEVGNNAALPYGMSPSEANGHFRRYLQHLKAMGVRVLSTNDVVSSANHRLGPAPFNYPDSVYHSLSDQLFRYLSGEGLYNRYPALNWDARHQCEIKTWTTSEQADFSHEGRTEHLFKPLRARNELVPARVLVENTGSDILLVICHGALPRAKYTVPRFEWLATLSAREENRIFLSDTTLEQHDDLELAWFVGYEGDDLTARYAELVRRAADQLGATKIVFMGGSGGGFASLSLAAKFPGSRALVFNPQTVIRNYWNSSVDKFQSALFSEMQGRADLVRLGARIDVTILPRAEAHQIIYVQNDDDMLHVTKHLGPFASKNRIPPKTGVSDNGNVSLIVEHFASGHNMPYREVLLDFVDIAVSDWDEPLSKWEELPDSELTRKYRRETSCGQA